MIKLIIKIYSQGKINDKRFSELSLNSHEVIRLIFIQNHILALHLMYHILLTKLNLRVLVLLNIYSVWFEEN